MSKITLAAPKAPETVHVHDVSTSLDRVFRRKVRSRSVVRAINELELELTMLAQELDEKPAADGVLRIELDHDETIMRNVCAQIDAQLHPIEKDGEEPLHAGEMLLGQWRDDLLEADAINGFLEQLKAGATPDPS